MKDMDKKSIEFTPCSLVAIVYHGALATGPIRRFPF